MSEMIVRAAEQPDRPFLREMLEIVATSTYPEIMQLGRVSRRERLDAIFNYHYEQPGKLIWIAQEQGGERLGMVWLEPSIHPITELPDLLLLNLAVSEPARGRGVGTRLVEVVKEHCRKARVGRIRLFVNPSNAPAYRLYQRLGFEAQTVEMLLRV